MNKEQFDKLAEECGADPEVVADRLPDDAEGNPQVQEWMRELEEAWNEAAQQDKDYAAYCAAHRF